MGVAARWLNVTNRREHRSEPLEFDWLYRIMVKARKFTAEWGRTAQGLLHFSNFVGFSSSTCCLFSNILCSLHHRGEPNYAAA